MSTEPPPAPRWLRAEDEWLASAEPARPDVDLTADEFMCEVDDFLDRSLNSALQLLLTITPGDWSLGMGLLLAQLGRFDHGGRELSAAQRIDYLAVLERQHAHAAANQARLLAEIDRGDTTAFVDEHGRPVCGFARDEVACVLRVSDRTAQHRLKAAATLAGRLPDTLAALDRGSVTPQHAEAIVTASWTVPDDGVGPLETAVLQRAPEQTVGELRRSLRRAALRIDPSTAHQRHERAAEQRRVELVPSVDGMSELHALLPAPQASALYGRLVAAATGLPSDDRRSRDQQRADLLVDAVMSALPPRGLPATQGLAPQVQVLVSASTLAGLDEQPADLAGYGAITAATARRLAADPSGTWRRIVLDPRRGDVLEFGRRTYRPPAALRDHVVARDPVCAFRGCNRPSQRCQLDHRDPHRPDESGGSTSAGNLTPLCQHHHNLKTHSGWRYRCRADGTSIWTSPTGHEYRSHPPERWNHRPDPALGPAGGMPADDAPPF